MDKQHSVDQLWQQAAAWVEGELNGTVANVRPQGRWRNAWFFDLQRGDETLAMYFRGLRPGMGTSSKLIQLEADILTVLERHGLPVPHVYGVCPEPSGFVMECKPGRANLDTAESQQEREAVLDQYVDALVAMHAIDIEEFVAIGLQKPKDDAALSVGDLPIWEGMFRHNKKRPEAAIEFCLRWLKANSPADRSQCVFLHADAGQFIFQDSELTALLDFELSYLGDPAADLAGLRTRDISEPLGDLSRAYRRYEDKTGTTIDSRVVDFHTAKFALVTPLATAHVCAEPPPRLNLPQYLGWYLVYTKITLELIAGLEGVSLAAPAIPEAAPSRHAPSLQALSSLVDGMLADSEDKVLSYELDTAARLVTQLERIDTMGEAMDGEDWNERVALLGSEPLSWRASEEALEQLVLNAGPERNADLLQYLYSHTLRQLALLGPALREMEGSELQNP